MGTFMEEIILENYGDRSAAENGLINENQVRNLKVEAMPDTGAYTLVINEEIRQKLGLSVRSERHFTLANGVRSSYPLTEAVTVQWKNRDTVLNAIVSSGAKKVLIGALALEGMDLVVDPARQKLREATDEESCMILMDLF